MNVFKLLKEDHNKVKKLFKEYEDCGDKALKRKQIIADTVFDELEIHTIVEEEILYPKIKEDTDDRQVKELVNEAVEEHRVVKRLMKELKELKAGDEQFEAKFKVLRENVEHHIKEEENELFPKAKKAIALEVDEITEQLEERKEYLEEKQASL